MICNVVAMIRVVLTCSFVVASILGGCHAVFFVLLYACQCIATKILGVVMHDILVAISVSDNKLWIISDR